MLEGRTYSLFNDALNTFYLYGYIVSDHCDRERGNLLPPLHGLLFVIDSKGSLCEAFALPVMEHWLELEIAQWSIINPTIHHTMIFNDGFNTSIGITNIFIRKKSQ